MKQSQNVHKKKSFLELICHYPIASVFVLWVTFLMLAGLSTATLVNIDNSEETQITQITEPSTSALAQPSVLQQKHTLPWLSFGAIALVSALGCVILSQTLRSTGYRPVQRKPFIKSSLPPQSAESAHSDLLALPERSLSTEPSNKPLVKSITIVPKQQNHPLDWDEPSLADSLDMRQRRPLSHWL